jgi:CheY-like chemotaxis protein
MARVLVVDDDTYNRALLATLLESQDHEVLEASDAQQALLLAGDGRPDLVVLDLDLPGMHGVDLVKTLRAVPTLSTVSIVLYSATTPTDSLQRFMKDNGIEHAIPKPCPPEDILRIIARALPS